GRAGEGAGLEPEFAVAVVRLRAGLGGRFPAAACDKREAGSGGREWKQDLAGLHGMGPDHDWKKRVAWSVAVGDEHVLDAAGEQARDAEGQRQAGVVLAGLQRVDGLPRHVQALGKFALG